MIAILMGLTVVVAAMAAVVEAIAVAGGADVPVVAVEVVEVAAAAIKSS